MFGMSLLSTIGSAIASSAIQGMFSSNEAAENRKFQKQMSNTSYTRAVADMRNAGINPILAGKFGGASTPQGAMATMQAPDLVGAMSTAKDMGVKDQEIRKMEVEIGYIINDTINKQANTHLTEEQTRVFQETVNKVVSETRLNHAMALGKGLENVKNEIMAEYYANNQTAAIIKELGIPRSAVAEMVDKVVEKIRQHAIRRNNWNPPSTAKGAQ